MEKLICNCDDNTSHHVYMDKNNETVIECEVCKRFIKFPSEKPVEPQENSDTTKKGKNWISNIFGK